MLGLEDLVACKKTRCDKDWPMVRRLVDAHYLATSIDPTPERMRFWLRELRTPRFLVDCARRAPELAREVGSEREATAIAVRVSLGNDADEAIVTGLASEEARERAADEVY